jgi:hypothetical protein
MSLAFLNTIVKELLQEVAKVAIGIKDIAESQRVFIFFINYLLCF